MQNEDKNAAAAQTGESVQTSAAPVQPQLATTPDVTTAGDALAVGSAEGTTTQKQRAISAATKTSVSLKQKSQPQTVILTRFAGLTEDQLHRQMVAARDELFNRCVGVESYTKYELLPLCEEIIARYKQPGRKCRLNGKPTVEDYFKSINLNYNTVRVWIHRKKLQTAMFQPTGGSGGDGGDKTPKLSAASRRALIAGNHRAVEAIAAIEAGHDGKKEIAAFKKVMDAKRLDDILAMHEIEPDYKALLADLLDVLEKNGQRLPAAVLDAKRKAEAALTPKAKAAPAVTTAASTSVIPPPMDAAQAAPANGVSKRYRLIEHTIGSLTELVIMDGNKVYDCYSLNEPQEAQAMLDKLNAAVVAKLESEMAAA